MNSGKNLQHANQCIHLSLQRPRLHLGPLYCGARVLEPVDDVVDVERLAALPRLQRVQLLHVPFHLKMCITNDCLIVDTLEVDVLMVFWDCL